MATIRGLGTVYDYGGNKMLRKTSLVLAVVAALMLPSATFGKGGGHYGGYHGRYYWHSVWGQQESTRLQ